MRFSEKLLAPINTGIVSLLGIYQMITGLWLVMPWDSLRSNYTDWMPEVIIGIILTIIGSVITYGSIKSKFSALRLGTTMGYLFWFVSTILLIITNLFGIAWIACIVFCVYCLVIDLNLRVNGGNSK